jgi:hypothetical protein
VFGNDVREKKLNKDKENQNKGDEPGKTRNTSRQMIGKCEIVAALKPEGKTSPQRQRVLVCGLD